MPDVYGPFAGATWQQGGWFRDAWARSNGGVFGGEFGTPGVGDLALTVAGLTVTMGLGRAHVRGAGYERTGTAWSYATPPNTATNPRIDRLVLRRDLAAGTVLPTVLQGTPAASPAVPALTQAEDGVWDLPLHYYTVPANSGAPITGVVDERAPARAPRYWGTINTNATLPTVSSGAQYGDTCYIVPLRSHFVFSFGNTWRQINVAQCGDFATIDTVRTGWEAAGGTVPNGFLAFDTTEDVLWVANGGTGSRSIWKLAGGGNNLSTTYDEASGLITGVASGWSLTSANIRRGRNGRAFFDTSWTRTGAAIAISGDPGNIANTTLGTLAAAWRPSLNIPLTAKETGALTAGYLSASGGIVLTAVIFATSLPTGTVLQLTAGFYDVDDPSQLY
jgi:hypothetical protein